MRSIKRNAFNLYIVIDSNPLNIDSSIEKYDIKLKFELTKKDFVCLFGQKWCCFNKFTYAWIYDKKKLLCKLKQFWNSNNENYKLISNQFLNQFTVRNVIPNVELLQKSFLSDYNGIFYEYLVKNTYEDISYLLDINIDRSSYKKQLFYYDKCQNTYPNLPDSFYILLYGDIFIFNKRVSLSLIYKIKI